VFQTGPLTWQQMRERTVRSLVARTGEDVDAWNRRIAEHDFADETALRAWLGANGVTGYPQMLLMMERIGLSSPGDLDDDLDDEAVAVLRRAYEANA
jgi:hypothetical protein